MARRKGGYNITYLEILSWARKGVETKKAKLHKMQEKAIEGQVHSLMRDIQEQIDGLDVKMATLDEIEEIHNRK